MKEIYTFLTNNGVLLERHKAELIESRGFPEKAISDFKFFSGGDYLLALEPELSAKFKEQDLVSCGVFIHENQKARMNPLLARESNLTDGRESSNIIIPYLDADGNSYCVRPHKLGLKGVPAEIYQDRNIADRPTEVVLTEGEFKAAAGMVFGIPTVSIPGISSFSESNYPRLVEFLKGIKKIIVMFDNEVKNDPLVAKRYKESPSDRYDTQFYAYYMATKLEQSGFEVRVATLPDSWRIDGKIDMDGALKAGKLKGDMLRVIYDALPRNEYLSQLPNEAKQVVLRKRAQKVVRGHVKKEFNRYVASRRRGNASWEDPISDFVIKIVATHDTPDGIKREVEFVNEFGKRSGSFSIEAEAMSSADKFRTFCLRKGDYTWKGTLDDLMTIWQSEFLTMDEGRYIVESDHVGWQEGEKVWLFGNVVFAPDPKTGEMKEIRADKNGIFWLEKRGIKASPLSVTTGKSSISEGIPYVNTMAKVDMREVLDKFSDTIGREEACVALGWVSAVPFMDHVFDYCGSFPFLFVTGQLQSGKSTIADWLTRFFGIEQGGKSMSQTTAVGIQRILAYYSCLPAFLDEYRNTKEIVTKNGFLRNVYNRQSSGKGIKADFGLREAKVRGTLIVAGEETPKDGALLTRFIPIFVSRARRKANHFNWFNANKGKFSSHLYWILKNQRELGPVFAQAFRSWQDRFVAQGIEDRLALNYAAVVAGHTIVYGESGVDFAGWLMKETKAVQDEQGEDKAINVFMDDLVAMKSRKLVAEDFWDASDGRKAYIYFHGLHQIWAEQYRKSRGEEAFKEGSIRAYLKEEPGFLSMNFLKKIKGSPRRCVVFDLAKCSREIRILVDAYVDGEDGDVFSEAAERQPGEDG